MLLYIKTLNTLYKDRSTDKFSKVAEWKINIQKLITFDISTMNALKKKSGK